MSNEIAIEHKNGAQALQAGFNGVPEDILGSIRDAISDRYAPTPEEEVSQRKGKAGATYDYVKRRYVVEWLNEHFPGMWSFKQTGGHVQVADFIYVPCELEVVDPTTGIKRVIGDYGADEAIYNSDTGKFVNVPYLKAAVTDGLKRCAVQLGCALDLYDGDDDKSEDYNPEAINKYFESVLPLALKKVEDGDLEYKNVAMQIKIAMTGDLKAVRKFYQKMNK